MKTIFIAINNHNLDLIYFQNMVFILKDVLVKNYSGKTCIQNSNLYRGGGGGGCWGPMQILTILLVSTCTCIPPHRSVREFDRGNCRKLE